MENSRRPLLASAKDYLAKKDNRAAVIQLKSALQKQPDLAEARFLLGRTLLEGGDAVSGEVELRKALDLKYPKDVVLALACSAPWSSKARPARDPGLWRDPISVSQRRRPN